MYSLTRHVTRYYSTVHYGSSIDYSIKTKLRELLRETAQPVAVVTSFMPQSLETHPTKHKFHGATLSSFTSIAMEPYPLITFALRIPSRMSTSLKSAAPDAPSHMVINLLSAVQESAALKFSRPDLYPDPFSSIPHSLTTEGLPILKNSLGAVSCKLVTSALPLYDLDLLERQERNTISTTSIPLEKGVASELFIARVIRVECSITEDVEVEGPRTLPLLYRRRAFTTCSAHHPEKPK